LTKGETNVQLTLKTRRRKRENRLGWRYGLTYFGKKKRRDFLEDIKRGERKTQGHMKKNHRYEDKSVGVPQHSVGGRGNVEGPLKP